MVGLGLEVSLYVLLPLFTSVPKLDPWVDAIGWLWSKAMLLSAEFPRADKTQAPAHTSFWEWRLGLGQGAAPETSALPSPTPSSRAWPKPLAGPGGRLQAPVVLGGNRRFCFECLQPGWECSRVAAGMCGAGYFRGGSSLPPNGLRYRLTRKKPFIHIPANSQLTTQYKKEHREFCLWMGALSIHLYFCTSQIELKWAVCLSYEMVKNHILS